ncbi:MAG: CaiB/BaiF CoA transferase family protein [Rhodothalassiaceae bacterium]
MPGPLHGLRVVEIAGIGPAPFAGMMLADLGADVVRIDKPAGVRGLGLTPAKDIMNRSKASLVLNLKDPAGVAALRRIWCAADGLIEGLRPGVMERLGLGPDLALQDNPRLVYGRMTGWGQSGPRAAQAGHDINYIGLSGVLAAIGRAGQAPVPPLNLVGDFGGGAMLLTVGMLAGLLRARIDGRGDVIDAAMTDGSALLMAPTMALAAMGAWTPERGVNLLDGGAPFYDVYETADGRYMAVGALEPAFFQALLTGLGLAEEITPAAHYDRSQWPRLRRRLTEAFKQKSQADWCRVFDQTDACVTPVLRYDEAAEEPHTRARGTVTAVDGLAQPAPAPRFQTHAADPPTAPAQPGEGGAEMLARWGVEIDAAA